jgi:3-carboxy-cis,cis-muconate cycloisomerase
MICEYVVGLVRIIQRNATLSFDAMIQEHERDMSFWTTEWSYIPQISILTGGAIEQMQGILERFIVHEENMKTNLDQLKGLIVSENLMLKLGEYVGRQVAHDIIYDTSMKAFESKQHLVDVALEDPKITEHLTSEEIRHHLKPETYVGLCSQYVKRVENKWKE